MMTAFAITAPGQAEFREIPVPVPAADEVLVRVCLVGYCGSDLNTFRGLNPMVSYPRIPGHEISGIIETVGREVPGAWQPGTAVTLSPYTQCGDCAACLRQRPNCCRRNQTLGVQRDGALTEFIAVPWLKLFSSPSLGLRELALVEPLTVGGHAVARGQVEAGDTVCVLGCGAIGLGAIAGAAFRGARVVAVDIDAAKLALATKAGAARTLDSSRCDLHAELQALTDGEGPDVIIEAIGLPATFTAAVEEVSFAGRVVYIGYAKHPVEYQTKVFVQKELDIRGSRNALPADFETVIRLLEARRFPLDEVVTRVYPFRQAGQALADWDAAPAAFTKILIQL
jgi:threonine dehydrogenase-like Zn-dependent dehydrogenase